MVNLICAPLIHQGSKIRYKDIVMHKIEQQSVRTDFRNVAAPGQSPWMWQSDMDEVAGTLGGVVGDHF